MAEPIILCPECGAIVPKSAAKKHSLSHWPEMIVPDPVNQKARERQKVLLDFAAGKTQEKPTEAN